MSVSFLHFPFCERLRRRRKRPAWRIREAGRMNFMTVRNFAVVFTNGIWDQMGKIMWGLQGYITSIIVSDSPWKMMIGILSKTKNSVSPAAKTLIVSKLCPSSWPIHELRPSQPPPLAETTCVLCRNEEWPFARPFWRAELCPPSPW